jgi:hypothetical protein
VLAAAKAMISFFFVSFLRAARRSLRLLYAFSESLEISLPHCLVSFRQSFAPLFVIFRPALANVFTSSFNALYSAESFITTVCRV